MDQFLFMLFLSIFMILEWVILSHFSRPLHQLSLIGLLSLDCYVIMLMYSDVKIVFY